MLYRQLFFTAAFSLLNYPIVILAPTFKNASGAGAVEQRRIDSSIFSLDSVLALGRALRETRDTVIGIKELVGRMQEISIELREEQKAVGQEPTQPIFIPDQMCLDLFRELKEACGHLENWCTEIEAAGSGLTPSRYFVILRSLHELGGQMRIVQNCAYAHRETDRVVVSKPEARECRHCKKLRCWKVLDQLTRFYYNRETALRDAALKEREAALRDRGLRRSR